MKNIIFLGVALSAQLLDYGKFHLILKPKTESYETQQWFYI
jgi:hypothetical protein